MSEENTKLKVKDLPESERKELLEEMLKVGLKGVLENYQVETARQKIAEKKAANGDGEQNNQDGEQNAGNGEQNSQGGENSDVPEQKNPEENEQVEPAKVVKNNAVKTFCHICYGEVQKGVCTKCGFVFN